MSREGREGRDELSAAGDPLRWEAAVRAITAAARPELERRVRASSPMIVLADWTRPVLSAAAMVALLASAAILSRGGRGGELVEGSGVEPEAVASALLPGAMSTWVMGGETESVVALVQALEEER